MKMAGEDNAERRTPNVQRPTEDMPAEGLPSSRNRGSTTRQADVRGQTSEVRRQRSEAGNGAVRTSVTLLGQDMGNTLLITVYTSWVDLQFYSGGYPPE